MVWTGRILTGIFTLFMLVASISPKLIGADVAVNSLRDLGWPEGLMCPHRVVQFEC
ncbi:conserved hypothetical protein [Ruegeria sp. TrichCH4B]|nr:conserved hypothetical protein [Ruegeria sp. TrichCH4B]